MLTCNFFQHTCFSCLKSTFFILSYQLHCCWLDDPHRFPGPTHSTGGRGVDVMTMTMAGGVGGRPGTWNIYIYIIYQYIICFLLDTLWPLIALTRFYFLIVLLATTFHDLDSVHHLSSSTGRKSIDSWHL